MNQKFEEAAPAGPWHRGLAALLAALCTACSTAVAVASWWQPGAATVDFLLSALVSVVAVLGAQFLPVLGLQQPRMRKLCCAAMWAVCVAYTTQTHARFLLAAQERNGLLRVQEVLAQVTSPGPAVRDLPAILNDKAIIYEQLARIPSWTCDDACSERRRLRKGALEQRLLALEAEAREAADARDSHVRLQSNARRARKDLVGNQLADTVGLSYEAVTGVLALSFALILEGVGALCWAIVIRSAPPAFTGSQVSAASNDPSNTSNEAGPVDPRPEDPQGCGSDHPLAMQPHTGSLEEDVIRVASALRDTKIKATVRDVRAFLRCSQARAREVRRLVGHIPHLS